MKLSISMPFICLLFYFLIRVSAQYCAIGYLRVLNAWMCISKKRCLERGFVISNGYCLRTCPRAFYLSHDGRTCHRSCPDDTVVNGSNCLNSTQCTAKDMFVYNGSCVDSCPLGTLVTMSDICVHNCPHQTITNTTHCVNPHSCTEGGKVIFNNTCTGQCPPGFPYVDSGWCASDCRDGKVSYNHLCITQHRCVHEEGKVIQNGSCVGSCSPDSPIVYQGQCHSDCPSGTFLNASMSTCLADSVCTQNGQFILNKTCIAECPRYVNGKACVDECPRQTVLYHKECITTTMCTQFQNLYMYLFNGTCVESCPDEAPYIDGKNCFAVCPLGKVADDTFCVFKYECKPKVIYNNTCLTGCPETAPLSTPETHGATYCVSACPVKTVRQNIMCITSDRCISQGSFVFNRTCLTTCPEEAPYISGGICHNRCPSSTVKKNYNCFSKDWCTSKGNLFFNGKCLTTCPEDAPYISNGVCEYRCPTNTVKQNYTCFNNDWCTSRGNMVYEGQCLNTCPEEAPYRSGGICHQQCQSGQRAAGTECIECESGKLLDGKECIYGFTCHERNKFEYEGNCLSSCPHGTKETIAAYTKTCLTQPNLPLLLTLMIGALVVCTAICLCMTIPRNGVRTSDDRIKTILTTKTRRHVYENQGFEEHEVRESCDHTNDVETRAFHTPDNEEVVGSIENVCFIKETDEINHNEI